MDNATARKLNDLTGDFYRRQSASFSETRQTSWEGWDRVLDATADALAGGRSVEGPGCAPKRKPFVLDVGCGNLRFERFLTDRAIPFDAVAVDRCVELMDELSGIASNAVAASSGRLRGSDARLTLREADIIASLLDDGATLEAALGPAERYDLVVAFGFMHHIPGDIARTKLCRALYGSVAPGGYLALSFWQFLRSPRIARKAHETTERAQSEGAVPGALDENDHLLGWQHAEGIYRYCHHFEESEIERLVSCLGPTAREVDRFSADGKSHDLNRYLVIHKNLHDSAT